MTFREIVDNSLVPIGNQVLYLLYALAFLLFLFGMFRYFFTEQGDEGRKQGRQFMLWGIIGLIVMFVVWGVVGILLGVLKSWA